jgi:hypothetical protein
MKNLVRILITLIATQLFVAGFARASVTSTVDQKTIVNVMPDDDPGPTETF